MLPKLLREFSGTYKVVSDFGYCDGSTLESNLFIEQALIAYMRHRYRENYKCVSEFLDRIDLGRIEYDYFDSSLQYYLVHQNYELPWERPDFDAGCI